MDLPNLANQSLTENLLTQISIIHAGTQLQLEHQYNKLPKQRTIKHALAFTPLIKDCQNWPKQMATSPLGHHLGVYKSLLKDQHHEKEGKPITTKGIDNMMVGYLSLQSNTCTPSNDGRLYGIYT